jgi:hypothetical protein
VSIPTSSPSGSTISYQQSAIVLERNGRPMLRIEKESDGGTTSLRFSGRIQSSNIGSIRAEMDDDSVRILLDLAEVTLVDVEVVRFLSDYEDGVLYWFTALPMCASGFFASEPKGHSRRFRITHDSLMYVRTIELGKRRPLVWNQRRYR